MDRNISRVMALVLSVCVFAVCAGCGKQPEESVVQIPTSASQAGENVDPVYDIESAYVRSSEIKDIEIADEVVALSEEPALPCVLMPAADGILVNDANGAVIDYSNTKDGYVMVKFKTAISNRLKVQVKGPSGVTYTYDLGSDNEYDTFPLSDGSGSYKVTVFKNVQGTSYSTVTSVSFDAALEDEFAPFLLPNQYVNYNSDTKCVLKAAELADSETDTIKLVSEIYSYVIGSYTYDYDKAASVKSGYLPDLDTIYDAQKGICFDYASLMAAMLRSLNIPTKLIVGYSGSVYHAWINVYSAEQGWVNGVIFFDGTAWKLMDPTFASGASQNADIMKYIGDNTNYSAKYSY